MSKLLLEVKNLVTEFKTDDGYVKAVNGISFTLNRGETIGIVGESGSGKSVTSLSVMRLIPNPPGRIASGEILYHTKDGKVIDLTKISEDEMRKIRGNEIAMIFQEPMTSLNPVYAVGEQIAEVVRLHQQQGRRPAMDRAVEMLQLVRIPRPEQRVRDYPHQFSGGMRQRVMIAIALACDPDVLIADEPTTALDVTVQAQILQLLKAEQARRQFAILLITHDLSLVRYFCQRVVVLDAGRIIEERQIDGRLSFDHAVGKQLQAAVLPVRPTMREPVIRALLRLTAFGTS